MHCALNIGIWRGATQNIVAEIVSHRLGRFLFAANFMTHIRAHQFVSIEVDGKKCAGHPYVKRSQEILWIDV